MKNKKPPVALVVEDDEMQGKVLSMVLKKFGITSEITRDSKTFLQRMNEIRPDLCLIDLNIDAPGVGFTVIKAVRKVMGQKPVLIVVSGSKDSASIAHAMESGANDYITKPIDREVLASKLSGYTHTDELQDENLKLIPIPHGGSPATLSVELEVLEVDEIGLKLTGPHLLPKGMVFPFSGPIVEEITGRREPILLTVINNWSDPDSKIYGALAEFDPMNDTLTADVRKWLGQK